MQIKLWSVKTTSVIDGGHHVFYRVVGFEKKTLVALHGIRGRMAFGKSITGKTFDLTPDVLNQIQRLAVAGTIIKKLIFDFEKLLFTSVFTRHAPTQHIGLS